MKLTEIYKLRDGIQLKEEDLGGTIYNRETKKIILTNRMAFCILKLINGTNSIKDITSYLCKEYDAPAEKLNMDVLDFIKKLKKHEIIEAQSI